MDAGLKKTVVTLILLLIFLLSAIAGIQFVDIASAEYSDDTKPQFYATQSPPGIKIESPATNVVYELSVPLKFTINYYETNPPHMVWLHHPVWIGFSVDGASYVTIESSNSTSAPHYSGYTYEILTSGSTSVNAVLDTSALANGQHTITVKADFMYAVEQINAGHYNFTFSPVSFKVHKPSLVSSVLSPTRGVYNSSDIPLNFIFNRQIIGISWIGYSLDNQPNITISGNTTLTGLPGGSHSLVVYLNDTFGNMAEAATSKFSVESQSMPFPILPVTIALVVAIVCAGLLVYFKKCRHGVETV